MITKTDKLYLFWQTDSNLSNWARTNFIYKGTRVGNSETAYMYEKAMSMGDTDTASLILESKQPSDTKRLGRQVKNYDDNLWNSIKLDIMTGVVLTKARSHTPTYNELESTLGLVIAEASPKDKIWGIGLAPNDAKALDMGNWIGENLLGKAWMVARDIIFDENYYSKLGNLDKFKKDDF